MSETPTPGTPEWEEYVAEQKAHPQRDGHVEVTPGQAAEAWAAYEAQMAEEANQSQQAEPSDVGKDDS